MSDRAKHIKPELVHNNFGGTAMITSPRQFKYKPIADAAISLVPNWYVASCGANRYSVDIGGEKFPFFSQTLMSDRFRRFHQHMNECLAEMCQQSESSTQSPLFHELVQERLILIWLSSFSTDVQWQELLDYLRSTSRRTYENHPVAINLVIDPKGHGVKRIDLKKQQKFLDQLASSPFTYFRIDSKLKFVKLEEIRWGDIKDSLKYKFLPEFLHPFNSILKEGQFSVHVTGAGDWIFMNSRGLLATRRKASWKVYDIGTFRRMLHLCMKSYKVGASLFEIAFDLSFKRHGALLVYDPELKVVKQLVNQESRIWPKSKIVIGSGQSLVADSVRDIGIGKSIAALKNKRLLTELASIDGAVIFNDDQLLAVGAIIKPNKKTKDQSGARSTAALSAYYWGGRPLKVSADGEVTLYFESKSKEESCDAKIEFL